MIFSLVSNVLPALSGAAAFFLLVRLLGREEVGEWIIFLTAITLFEMVRSGLVQAGFVRSLSGAPEVHGREMTAAAWVLAGTVSSAVVLTAGVTAYMLPEHWLVVSAIGVYALVSLPLALGEWTLQARDAFGSIIVLRTSNRIPFLATVAVLLLTGSGSPLVVYSAFLSSILASSVIALSRGWVALPGGSRDWKPAFIDLFRFGRSSLWSAAGSNLLRSSDTMLIGALSGAASAALYGLPLRILEVIELPVRSLVQVFYPRLSSLAMEGRLQDAWLEWRHALGRLSLLVFAVAGAGFILAEPLVAIVGGDGYGESVTVLRWMFAFSVLIPLDRLTGIFLDALGHPARNARKVWMMLTVNVLGDVIVLVLGLPIWSVAAVSILTFGLGCLNGLLMVRRLVHAEGEHGQDVPAIVGGAS